MEEITNAQVVAHIEELRGYIHKARPARRWLDLDVRGLLAIMAVLGAFALAFVQLGAAGNSEIPTWAAAMVTGVVGFYFGSKGAASSDSNGNGNGNGKH